MLWKEAHRKDAQELITWLLESKPGPNVWTMDRPIMIGLVELAYSTTDPSMTDQTVMQVLDRMYNEKETTVADFEAHYEKLKQERSQAERAGQADWTFYIPLDLRLAKGSRTRKIQFLGRQLRLLTVATTLRQLPTNPVFTRIRRGFSTDLRELRNLVGHEVEYRPGAFVSIEGRGAHLQDAWEDAEPLFSAFRGLFEFTFGIGSARIAGREKPRAKVPHPTWVLAVGADENLNGFAFETEDERRAFPFEVTAKRWRALARNTEPVKVNETVGGGN